MTALDTVAPTLSPWTLPRAHSLTDVLMSEGQPPGAAAVSSARRLLEQGLARVASDAPQDGACVRIRAFDLVRADADADGAGGAGGAAATAAATGGAAVAPFRWTTRTARRRVGLAVLRLCLAEPGRLPAEAAGAIVADPSAPTGPGPHGPGSCTDWLANLSPAARSLVQAEATAWATRVWAAVEWDRLRPAPVVGGPDRWWDWRGAVRVALQGRADVRLPGPGGAHLVVLDGFPSSAARRAMGFGALVDALRSGGADTPSRAVAWWPDCGKAWVTPIDGDALRACAERVVVATRTALGALTPTPPPTPVPSSTR